MKMNRRLFLGVASAGAISVGAKAMPVSEQPADDRLVLNREFLDQFDAEMSDILMETYTATDTNTLGPLVEAYKNLFYRAEKAQGLTVRNGATIDPNTFDFTHHVTFTRDGRSMTRKYVRVSEKTESIKVIVS
jgi:hypothetical protein